MIKYGGLASELPLKRQKNWLDMQHAWLKMLAVPHEISATPCKMLVATCKD